MKKSLFTLIFILSANTALAATHYKILPGSLHKGGKMSISSKTDDQNFKVKLKYELKKRMLVPISSDKLKGEKVTELPFEYSSEDGYLELENQRTARVKKATLKFISRVNYGRYTKAYKFKIIADNGKSETEVIYHPQGPGIGWLNIKILFKKILDGYLVQAVLK